MIFPNSKGHVCRLHSSSSYLRPVNFGPPYQQDLDLSEGDLLTVTNQELPTVKVPGEKNPLSLVESEEKIVQFTHLAVFLFKTSD